MNPTLATKLIEKGVLAVETEVEAEYPAVALGGAGYIPARGIFLIQRVFIDGSKARFDVISTRDGTSKRLASENIVAIDGMDPERFASVYNVKADGADAKLGKRRGRKPKQRTPLNG